jgi:hypothetical protein
VCKLDPETVARTDNPLADSGRERISVVMQAGEGSVWVRCLGQTSIFAQRTRDLAVEFAVFEA